MTPIFPGESQPLVLCAARNCYLHYGAVTLFRAAFQRTSYRKQFLLRCITSPLAGIQFALLPFRSPLLRESLLISFPPGTKMFYFPGFPITTPKRSDPALSGSHHGFRHGRVNGRVRLTRPFRSLPRPSSASGTESSIRQCGVA